jgi:membrane associated rhomboid family serine protease
MIDVFTHLAAFMAGVVVMAFVTLRMLDVRDKRIRREMSQGDR